VSAAAFAIVAAATAAGHLAYPFAVEVARAAAREDLLPSASWPATSLVSLTFSATGLVIHRREPHLVGWIMHAVGLLFAVTQVGIVAYIVQGAGQDLGGVGAVLTALAGFAWIPALVLMSVFLPLVFPTGRPPGPGWWWTAAIGGTALAYGFVSVTVESLTRAPDEVSGGWPVLPGLMLLGALGAMGSVVYRFRRAGPTERRQIKWVAAALGLVCGTVALSLTPIASGTLSMIGAQLALFAIMCTIPVSVGIAITRYRLYEIDRIISRTVSYALLTLILVGVYLVVVVGLQLLLRPLTGESQLAVAGATLTVAALFAPARRRFQVVVDRRFNRARYDAQHTVDNFRLLLPREVDLDQIGSELTTAVRATVQPSTVALWVRPSAGIASR
jgi:hypothetical protein